MRDWVIRPYQPADAEAISRIYNYYVLETDISFDVEAVSAADVAHKAKAIMAASPYLVAVLAQQVVGYAYAKPWHSLPAYAHTFESTIYLAHDRDRARCRGLGSALYQALIDGLREQGNVHILFGIPTLGNVASERLHEKLRFTKQAVFHDVGHKHGRWLGVTYWAKSL